MSYPVRRVRRSKSRRRPRFRRRIITLVLLGLIICGGFWLGSRVSSSWPAPNTLAANSNWEQRFPSANRPDRATLAAAAPREASLSWLQVNPYSVVPGGVHSPQELREAVMRDPVVARHYAAFDLKHARMMELKHSCMVYLAYRLGEKIYWTRSQIMLRQGEKLITDGKIMARARCGNRVSSVPEKADSPDEPPAETLEEPGGEGSGAHFNFPGTYKSALLNREGPSGFEGLGPVTGPVLQPTTFSDSPTFFSPPLPGACAPVKKPKPKLGGEAVFDAASAGKKKKTSGCGSSPVVVPEPGTIFLVSSGIAGIYLRRRKSTAKASSPE